MDQFENTVPDMENDPVAEFLAREQNALADLDIDNNQTDDNNLFNNNHNDDNNIEHVEPINELNDNFEMIINNNHNDNDNDIDDYNDIDKNIIVQPKIESEKIRKWREQQKDILQKKNEEEEIKKRELHEQAKNELEDWYKKHDESISKTKASNRNADKQLVNDNAELDKIEPGMQWERIAKLCDFNSKTNKTNKDVSRMRSILLQLKQN